MEDILDDISEGKKIWYEELRKFYDDFMPLVNNRDFHSTNYSYI